MSRPILAALLAAFVLAPPLSAPAQSQSQDLAQTQAEPAPPSTDGGRYAFHRVGEGFVRLDSVTGQVAQCSASAVGWSCKAAPDERLALESEIARLQRENAALKKTMLAKGLDLPGGATAETRPVPPASIPETSENAPKGAPSEAEFDRAIAYMKNVWKKLVDMMLDLQRDIQRKS
ncbi:MAG: hypothetical protein K2Z80_37610 [Xanthobacteraceae bacterium]|nr:hypothetical protein [Xanthobacteraceae bacterium]